MSNIKIVKPDLNFDFSNLNLSSPSSLTNQTFFSKLTNNNEELFLLTPTCKLKNGIISSSKTTYCDLMFNSSDDNIISYMENLENTIHKMIYARREKWFHDTIEMDDIENIFTSPLKSFKSGKYFTLRVFTNSPRNILDHAVKVYDQFDNELSLCDINNDDVIRCVVHVNGLKFSSKLFQLYFELKQVVILNKDSDPFSKNLIVSKVNESKENIENDEVINEEIEEQSNIITQVEKQDIQDMTNETNLISKECINNENVESNIDNVPNQEVNELNEINISIPDDKDTMKLNNVVIDDINNQKKEMYYKAKSKAIEARLNALKKIAEANELKNTLLLDKELLSECDNDDLSIGDLDELSDSSSECLSLNNDTNQETNDNNMNNIECDISKDITCVTSNSNTHDNTDNTDNLSEDDNINLNVQVLGNNDNLQVNFNDNHEYNTNDVTNEINDIEEYSDDNDSLSSVESERERITIHY